MIMLSLVASAHDIEVNNADGVTIYYNYANDGKELEVTFRGSSATDYPFEYTGNIVIPESVNYNNVTYSVTSISEDAFKFCSGLTSVTIGNNVTSIGAYAFNQCSGLTSVTIPNSVTSIGNHAFYGCYPLTSVTIPNSVTSIGDRAFAYCIGLTSVTIGNSVTSIGDGAFNSCRGLTSIEIPNSVMSIGISAFSGCTGLTSVTINSNAVVSQNYSSTSSLKDIFGNQVQEYILGDEVQSIGNYAFYGCSGLTSFTIPNNVTRIGNKAFEGCPDLKKVIVFDIVAWCGINFGDQTANPLYNAHNLYSDENTKITDLKIPNSVTSIGNYAFSDCSGLTSVTIPNSVTSIGNYAFQGCSGLTSVTIPNSVTSIGDRAFSGCIGLTSVTIGNSVTSIGDQAFNSCRGLTSVTIPNSVTSIGDQAFNSCRGLTSIEIPNSVTSIGDGAFSGCSSLTSVTINSNAVVSQNYSSTSSLKDIFGTQVKEYIIGNEVHGIGESAFEGSSGLISVTIPNNIISIGIAAFSGCSGLTSVTVEDGNSTYDSRNNCNAIIETATNMLVAGCKNTVIPNSVTSISYKAFFGCSGLTSVTIPNCVTSIGEQAFSGCSSLTSVTINSNAVVSQNYSSTSYLKGIFGNQVRKYIIGNEVQSIGNCAFLGCSSLTSVTIGNSVTSIGNYAFSGCSGLTSITIPNSVTSIGAFAFDQCFGLTSVTIPDNVTSIGGRAFFKCYSLTSVTIGNSVTSIGGAFEDCTGLQKVIVKNLAAWCGIEFDAGSANPLYYARHLYSDENTEIKDLVIPDDVMRIGKNAFSLTDGLTSVYIPNSVTSIGDYAFIGCSSLTSVTIIGNTEALFGTSVGESAFEGCKSLTSITIGKGVRSIGVNAFYRCKGLTTIDISNGVKFISIYAFMDCSNLRTVTLGNSVTSIGGKAFYGCSSLTSVKVYAKTPPTAGQVAFPNYDHAIKLYVPRGSKASYAAANVWKDFSSINVFGIMVTADDLTMVYGDAVPELTYKTEGGSFTGAPQITCEATSTSPVGTYPIVISKGTIDSDEVTYVNGKLTITKAPLKITAKSYTIKQGDALPTFEADYAGFKNNETDAVLEKKPTITTTATSASEPGTYEIVVSGAEAQNYDITYVKGTLTITKADEVVVTAKSYSRKYGEANPTFEYTTSGATLSGTPSISCEATATSPVGEYDIVVSKGSITNYNVTLVNGKLTVTKAPLTITAKSYTIKQGGALPMFEATYEGFKNNETDAVLTKKPTLSTTATSASEPGTYEITISGAEATNYDISYVKGTLTITKADEVVVTAKSYSREYGEANPTFEYTTSGATLSGTPSITCAATVTSPVGEYDIVASKGTVTNYNVTYVNGKLTITKAPLTITAKSYTIKQGDALPTFEAEYSGFKNNETASVLTTQPRITTSATSASAPGTYDIVVSGASATNYDISYVKGTLTITKADEVVVTAKSYSRKYGEANPAFEYTTSGATLSGTPSITCAATVTSPVGEYDIVASKGTVTNYNVTYVNGKLTITKAPLTITAKSYTIKQGDALPTFEADYSGFKNNETASVLSAQPRITTSATSASAPGTYDIVVSDASATNYDISYVKGTLTISPVDVEPVTETETTTFSETVNENTNLSNTVIDNTYFNMNAANGDGYDATEQAIVLNSTTTESQMNTVENAEVGDAAIRQNFNGIIFEVAAGSGTITIDVKTKGTYVLNVQIGKGEPNKITKSERGTADVAYNVTAPTYIYLYASTASGNAAPRRAAGANSVLLYGYKVTPGGTGIREISADSPVDVYNMQGNKVRSKATTLSGLPKGIYIVNGRKVIVK